VVAASSAATTNEDTAVTIDVLSNDSDIDGDTLSVTSASAANGSVTINVDGTLEYTPNANFNGSDTISYEIADGNGGTSSATVTVTVNAVNDGPVASDDSASTNEDTAVTIDVLSNDSDIDGDTLSVTSASAANGSVTVNVDGTLDYTPDANFNGTDTISYEIADGNGGTSTASVTVTVNAVNDGPVAADDLASTDEDTSVTIDVLPNDTDIDGDSLAVTSATASNGSVSINVDGTLDYTPNANFNGTDTISYEIADGNGGTSTASVTVTVNAVNDGPVAADDAATTNEDTAVNIDVLGNDSDIDGDTLSVASASASNGSVSINVDGTLEYTPNANFNGTDTISYEIADGNGGTSTASVTVTVNAVNDGPVAADDTASTNEDTAVTIDVLSNDSDIDGDTLSVSSASAANGSVTINVDGTLEYIPNATFNGTDTISYEVSDGNGGVDTASVTVVVNAINDAPIAVNDSVSTDEDTAVTIDVLGNDSDVDGDALSVISASATNGLVSINVDGTLEYTPNANFNGTDTISYEISDGNGATDTASVTVTVNAVNDGPVAADDAISTDSDTAITIDVLSNDSDIEGDSLNVTSATAGNGTVSINVDGSLNYTANADFVGTDTISYEITDGNGGTAAASVIVTVSAGNVDPVASDESVTFDEDQVISINVLANDRDVDGDPLTVSSASAENGAVVINPNGTLSYTPNANFNGADTISYEISDGRGGTSTANVSVTVNAVNDNPTLQRDTVMTNVNAGIIIDALANDSDVDGDALTITSASAFNGTVIIDENGLLVYTPNEGFDGTDSIIYEVSDGQGGSSTATVDVLVNNQPLAQDDTVTTNEETAVTFDVLANDSDIDGDELSVTSASATNGMVDINADGTLTYTPNAEFNGTDIISYEVSDGNGGASTASVTVTVNAENDEPVSNNDAVSVNTDSSVTIDVLENDTDADGDTLSVTSATAVNGTVVINVDGTLTYTPNANFYGSDSISYEVSDGNGGTSAAFVDVSVNSQPLAVSDTVNTDEDTAVMIDVLANDSDLDGDTLSVTTASAANGTVLLNSDGTLTYIPDANFNGSDTISYEVADGNGGTSSASVAVTVNAVNDAPVTENDSVTTNEDTTVSIDVLSNDYDIEGDSLTVTQASAVNGTVTIDAQGMLIYTPNSGFRGTDTVSYEVEDGQGGSSTASVSVSVVNPLNEAPSAVNDIAATNEDSFVVIDVLANDTDPDADPIEVTSATAANGTVSINSDGTLTYTPNADFNGSDIISYNISDGQGGTSSATVAVSVSAVNDNPLAINNVAVTDEDTAITIDVLMNDSDVEGDSLTVTSASAVNGIVTVNGDGTLSYTPNAGFAGNDTISYEISDGNGGTDTASVAVTVNAVNDAPVASDDVISTNEDTTVTIDVLANDSDLDGDSLSVTSATASNGTVTINVDGTLSYTPNADFNGTDIISYEITDGNGGSAAALATVAVDAVNDDPVAVNDSFVTDLNVSATIDVLANDTDIEGNELSVVSATAQNGSVSINVDGTLTYTPSTDFNGVDQISYEISDGQGGVSTATADITVNTPPIAGNDTVTTNEDTSVIIDVLSNDSDLDGNSLAIVSATAPNGTVLINLDGTLTYTPNANFYGSDNISYTITDGYGGVSSAEVAVTILPVNIAPIAVDDAYTTNESSTITINVLENDSDLDNDVLTVDSATALNGTVTTNPDNSLSYTPNANFNGVDSISYEISDGRGGVSSATAYITVNTQPDAVNDVVTVDAGSNGSIASLEQIYSNGQVIAVDDSRLVANDTDGEAQTLTITQVNGQDLVNGSITIAGSNGGIFTVSADGTASFDASTGYENLAEGESALTEVVYTVTDGHGGFDTATVQVVVNGQSDDAVRAQADLISADENSVITLDVLANDDVFIDGDVASVTAVNGTAANIGVAVTGSQGGLFTLNADGSASFDANQAFDYLTDGEVVTTSVTYTIQGFGGETSTSTVDVQVYGSNNAPVANDDFATVDAGSNRDIANLIAIYVNGQVIVTGDERLVANDTDAEGQTLTVTQVNGLDLVNGSITIAGSNGGVFTVDADGTASFDASTGYESLAEGESALTELVYTITDGQGGFDTATVQVTVNGQNDAVQAQADLLTADESSVITLDVLANDAVLIDGDIANVSAVNGTAANVGVAVTGSQGGLFTLNADGSASFDANQAFDHLTDGEVVTTSVTYTIEGFGGETSTSTVEVQVSGSNNAPVAEDDFASVEAGTNSDIANLKLIYVNGQVIVTGDNRLVSNDADAEGQDLIITQVNGQDLVNGSITIAGSNGGIFTVNADGAASFDATTGYESLMPGESALTELVYTISDGNGGFDTATLQVTINGRNDAPEATSDTATVDEDSTVIIDVLANDTDINGGELFVASASAANGVVVINADNTITYTPNANFNGSDIINYTVSDGDKTDSSTVAVTVTPINDAPDAQNDAINIDSSQTVIIDVLLNDIDVDEDVLTVTAASAANGNVTINPDGTLSYTADNNATGLDTISYEVSDGNGGVSSASVTVNRNPTAIDDYAETQVDNSVSVNVLSNDIDLDGDSLTVTNASALNGNVLINNDGTLLYTPNSGYIGSDTITYQVTDVNGGLSTAVVNIDVGESVNNPPVAGDDFATVDAGSDGYIANLKTIYVNGQVIVTGDNRLTTNDTDAEGQDLTITQVNGQDLVNGSIVVTGSNGGVFTVDADGTARFDASTGFEGVAVGESALTELVYTITDGFGGIDTATVQVTVNGQNDAVQAESDLLSAEETSVITLDVLANDVTFIDGDVANVSAVNGTAANVGLAVTGSQGGLFTLNADGSATFDANQAFDYLTDGEVVTTSVTYTIEGFGGETSTSTVEVQVSGSNTDPVANDDFATVNAGSNSSIANLRVIYVGGQVIVTGDNRLVSNDADAEGQDLIITQVNGVDLVNGSITVAGSNGGFFTVAEDGVASFDASSGYESVPAGGHTTSELTYTISDGNGGTDTAIVTVTIKGTNVNTIASDDSASTTESESVVIDVLANDADENGQTLAITSIDTSGLTGGIVVDNGDGTLTFDPNGQFDSLNDGEFATEWFEYTVEDGLGGLDTAQVQLTVMGLSTANEAPVAEGESSQPPVDEGTTPPDETIA
jgi:VCBS repeat-containing protein